MPEANFSLLARFAIILRFLANIKMVLSPFFFLSFRFFFSLPPPVPSSSLSSLFGALHCTLFYYYFYRLHSNSIIAAFRTAKDETSQPFDNILPDMAPSTTHKNKGISQKNSKRWTNLALGSVASFVVLASLMAVSDAKTPWPKYGEKPDTDTPEVKAWVKEVDWTKVPNLPVRKTKSPGDPPECPSNVAKGDCWWTCTGCYHKDDIVDCPGKKQWGLTFDDGPEPGTTEDLLELLNEKNATATFFVTGMKSAKAPNLLQMTLDKGHHLASHSKPNSAARFTFCSCVLCDSHVP